MLGRMFLKVLLTTSKVDTTGTVSNIRDKLSTLYLAFPAVNDDIPEFNNYVGDLQAKLAARGKYSTDLMNNMFRGYEDSSDSRFFYFIALKKEAYK